MAVGLVYMPINGDVKSLGVPETAANFNKEFMKYEYIVKCTINLREAVSEVDAVLNGIESMMKDCGLDEKLGYSGTFEPMSIKSDRELTEKEMFRMKNLIQNQFIGALPQYDIRVDLSMNKSCSQSYNATNVTNAQ